MFVPTLPVTENQPGLCVYVRNFGRNYMLDAYRIYKVKNTKMTVRKVCELHGVEFKSIDEAYKVAEEHGYCEKMYRRNFTRNFIDIDLPYLKKLAAQNRGYSGKRKFTKWLINYFQ